MEGKYIYGIIKNGDRATIGIPGLGGMGQVHIVPYGDLGCVLSDYSGGEFGSLSKEEVVRSLLSHQVVVEQVMREHTVLPVKFGTVLANSAEVQALLRQGQEQFAAALNRIRDRVEIEVAATWDLGQVLPEVGQEEEILRTREALAHRVGGPTLEERLHLGQMVKASLDRRREDYQEQMIDFLKALATDVLTNPMLSDQMVLNVAFLVEKTRQEDFEQRLGELNNLFLDRINFRIIGPLPPYSFATVEVGRLRPEQIAEARQLLGLCDVISEPEVRRAYRHRAAQTHPDRRPGDKLVETKFAQLRQASDLLVACCRGQANGDAGWLINIKRRGDGEVQHLRYGALAATGWER